MGERRKGARESWEHLLPRMDEDNSNTIELEGAWVRLDPRFGLVMGLA